MSRNVHQKYPSAPRIKLKVVNKKLRRPSVTSSESSLNLSGDEGYSGVEDVSESDNELEEADVVAAEEEHLITNMVRNRLLKIPRPLDEDNDADQEDEDEEDEPEEEEIVEENANEEEDDDDDSVSWQGLSPAQEFEEAMLADSELLEQDMTPVKRHVRFAGIDSDSDNTESDLSESDDGKQFFPDIFVDQNALDPQFRREIENDGGSDTDGSYWDFNGSTQDLFVETSDIEFENAGLDSTPMPTPRASAPANIVASHLLTSFAAESPELDGYETDGDTTEEDIPEPIVRKKQIRRPASVETSDSDTPRPSRHIRGKPRLARFDLDGDSDKPVGVIDPKTGKMMIFTRQKADQLDLAPESYDLNFAQTDLSACSPMMANSAFIMLGAMGGNPLGDFFGTQPFGPAEAFFPYSDAFTGEETDESEYYPTLEDEGEDALRLEDFIEFRDSLSDQENDDEDENAQNWNNDPNSSPTRPKTSASYSTTATAGYVEDAHPLLTHFEMNSNAVGAFRRNQVNQQLINSEVATQESLAFSGPYHIGTLRGIKTGSMETVTTPITPVRRHKKNSMVGFDGPLDYSPGSPLNHISQKRKASNNLADDNLHKRHRSISDMEVLQL
ncbi:hypothetical protein QBC40DRAFT_37080 [Triangularia verruculosa]|uniref:Uncharacterized protein n=1 Tax=Triangularia verruculosa TaxID=2587418 RepID=A0AAN6XLF5_9PEZI|nr:hypothetical protein QBC40DRAFT_37080 [Triangularia verruculosa]